MSHSSNRHSVLILGGKGALGSELIIHFKQQGYWVGTVDRAGNVSKSAFTAADLGILTDDYPIMPHETQFHDMEQKVEFIKEKLDAYNSGMKLDGIFCVAGGWKGGNLDPDFLRNADLMWAQSVQSALMAVSISATHLKEGGLLCLTGANAALTPTPDMISYGMAKAAVHHLTQSLGCKDSGLPEGAKAIAILPITLDTPANHQAMPDGDHGSWTPLPFISNLLQSWIDELDSAPTSGSLVTLITENGETVTEVIAN